MIRLILTGFFVVVIVSSSWAAEQSVAQMKDLIVLGLKNNLGLQVEKIDVASSREDLAIEAAVFDPQIFANAGYDQDIVPYEYSTSDSLSVIDTKTYSAEAGVSKKFETGLSASASVSTQRITANYSSLDLDPYARTFFAIELTQPLLRNYGSDINTTSKRMNENLRKVASLNYLLQAQSLVLALESAVYQLAGDIEVVALRQQAEDLAKELYTMNHKRYAAGLSPITEVQEAETALANRQLYMSQALEQYDLDRKSLKRQLNNKLPVDFDPLALVPACDALALEHYEIDLLLEEARNQRLDFKIRKLSMANKKLNQAFQENQLKPQLDLTFIAGINGLAGEDYSDNGTVYDGTWIDSLSSLSTADGYQWGVGVNFTMPLGNAAAKARVRQAEQQRRQESYKMTDLEDQVRDELEQQQIQLQRAWQQLQLAKRFAKLAQQSFDQEQRKLEEGLSDTFRMISFQDALIDAQINKINALTRYRIAQATMAYLRGEIFQRHGIGFTENAQEIHFEDI
jgi:outer membrane protein TolC